MNYVWTPSFPMDDHKEAIALLPISNLNSEKREFEPESAPIKNHSVKRQRRSKKEGSSSDDGNGTQDAPKDKGRGRYACLNHRMKHKRCPPDCKERRPKPMQPVESSPPLTTNFSEVSKAPINLPELSTPKVETTINSNQVSQAQNNFFNHNVGAPMAAPVGINPMVTVSALPPIDGPLEWDSVGWEGLMEDSQNQWGPEVEGWDDLHQNSHPEWESRSASSDGVLSSVMQADSDVSPSNASDGVIRDFAIGDGSFESFKEDVAPMLLTRDALERWIVEPYFNRLLQGFYVRIRIGEYMDTSVYRIAKIDEVVDRAFFAYNLGKEQTTKGLVLQIGSSTKKTFSLLSVSNKEPTDGDFQHWEEEMAKQRVAITEDEIRQKAEIVRVMNQKYPLKMSPAFASTSN